MDVFRINKKSVLLRHDELLIDLFLPEHFLAIYGITPNRNFVYTSSVCDYQSGHVIPYRRVWGKFIKAGEPDAPVGSPGLCVSIIVRVNQNISCLDMALLKVSKWEDGFFRIIKFSLLNLLRMFYTTPTPPISSVKKSAFEELCNQVTIDKPPTHAAASFLLSLLPPTVCEATKTHCALENPGYVRGSKPAISHPLPDTATMPCNNKRKDRHPRTEYRWKLLHNIETGAPYYVEDTPDPTVAPQINQKLMTVMIEEPHAKAPTEIFLMDSDFLHTVQNNFLDSIALPGDKNPGLKIFQNFPIFITSDETTQHLYEIFLDSLITLRSRSSKYPAWLMASYHGPSYQGVWLDIVNATATGEVFKGDSIYLGKCHEGLSPTSIDKLLKERGIFYNNLVLLLVHSDLTAWLLLPGGFAIKGTYILDSQAKAFIGRYYGDQRRYNSDFSE
ncbi:DNA packaging tegument protein UL17 [Wood mouse herpesvirus]|uniref:DNA packaging tegument protein UL17 n=1 Tax=Wood mouse herpesvirus TaxID=432370 RepID=D0U1M2_9GAMA|nr:DNA packaging tegument protein UL17 [Wood mouse herpesvirus]ACY41104.1 DNA packaging tegument protein UL17 [Wood mouse herpesvirus]